MPDVDLDAELAKARALNLELQSILLEKVCTDDPYADPSAAQHASPAASM